MPHHPAHAASSAAPLTPSVDSDIPKSGERLAAIIRVQQRIAAAGFDLRAVMAAITDAIEPLFGDAMVTVGLIEADTIVYRAAHDLDASGDSARVPLATSISGICIREGRALRWNDLDEAPVGTRATAAAHGFRSMLVAPLLHEGGAIGTIGTLAKKPAAFDDEALHALQLLAAMAASAIQHARDFAEKLELMAATARAADALRASEARFRTVMERSTDLVAFLEPDGMVRYASPSYERGFGYEPSELVGRSAFEFVEPEDVARAAATLAEVLARPGQSIATELRMRPKTGDARTIAVQGLNLLHDPLAGVIVFTGRDVTIERELEAQLLQAQKIEAVGQLAGGVAHDFNNLLTVIAAHTDLLLASAAPDSDEHTSISEIRAAASRAAALTRQLLAFSRKQLLQPQLLDLDAVVRGLEPLLRRLIIEDVTIVIHAGATDASIFADPVQVEQVLINLVVNARDAMPSGGTVKIETATVELTAEAASRIPGTHAGEYVRLAVRDTGTGMPDAVRARVFEPFFTTKPPGAGSGLGLSTVYGIVRQSGGGIDVDTAVGAGTSMIIYLPAADASLASLLRPEVPAVVEAPPERSAGETVLLVEDDSAVRVLVRRLLSHRGYRIIEATTGREGLRAAMAHTGAIDLVLTDLVMPDLDGRRMVEQLRRLRPDVAVLFMTGYTDDEAIRRGIEPLGGSVVQKPFASAQLLDAVAYALRARA